MMEFSSEMVKLSTKAMAVPTNCARKPQAVATVLSLAGNQTLAKREGAELTIGATKAFAVWATITAHIW